MKKLLLVSLVSCQMAYPMERVLDRLVFGKSGLKAGTAWLTKEIKLDPLPPVVKVTDVEIDDDPPSPNVEVPEEILVAGLQK